nr:hypothetical protein [Tanacetum cinerariifolium]
MEHGFVERG